LRCDCEQGGTSFDRLNPGPTKIASAVYQFTHAVGSGSSKASARADSAARMAATSDEERHAADLTPIWTS
jgi:hypothetical protein